MNLDLNNFASFGAAGNFTGHLEQAGEAADFAKLKVQDAGAPKALFPTYIPGTKNASPDFLHEFPFSADKIIFPKGETKLQIEPECAVLFEAEWSGDKISSLRPVSFGASNDCSIRKEGAKKISLKKNWGKCSKGLSENLIDLDEFTKDGILNRYRIASFLLRNGQVFEYGEDSAVRDYSYIYGRLVDWIIDRLNFQPDEGPQENIGSYLVSAGKPDRILVSIGATRYTEYGKTNFLQKGDKAGVILYPEDKYSAGDIKKMAESGNFNNPGISALVQEVVL